MARSLYDAAVLTTVVGWFYREGYRQQRPAGVRPGSRWPLES